MLYCDTRAAQTPVLSFTDAVLQGIAPSGGLYVPEHLPKLSLDEICDLATCSYADLAAAVYQAFDVNVPAETITKLMHASYGDTFDTQEICPITSLDKNTHILELFHGPTSAFKDMALQCLPQFFSYALAQKHEQSQTALDRLILVATSGDTGKGALEGFKDKPHTSICVLYPKDGVSDVQKAQMVTSEGANVAVVAIEGNFDDCQSLVKQLFGDKDFAHTLAHRTKTAFSSANSINWGRLLPQIVYYIASYARLVAGGKLTKGETLDVCVPTGNFGNILAAYYAKRMGTPLGHLICASNENNVLSDFLATGTYSIKDRPFVKTASPSMDILISSNLERLLFEVTNRDHKRVANWMHELKEHGCYTVDADTLCAIQKVFVGGWCSTQDAYKTIKQVYNQHNYLMDPHTAVAYQVAHTHTTRTKQSAQAKAGQSTQTEAGQNETPLLIASTAHWAKFGSSVISALDGSIPQALTGFEINESLVARDPRLSIPKALACLKDKQPRFNTVLPANPQALSDYLLQWLAR